MIQNIYTIKIGKEYFSSISENHLFTTMFFLEAKHFLNKKLAEKFIINNNIKGLVHKTIINSEISVGLNFIIEERCKQISKRGFTGEHHFNHPEWYDDDQLIKAARHLTEKDLSSSYFVPKNWDVEWFYKLTDKPYSERLIIAGSLIAAEIDRISFITNDSYVC